MDVSKYTRQELAAMLFAGGGADIYAYGPAYLLRQAHRKDPGAFQITKAMNPPDDVRERRPYFGCFVGAEARKAARQALGLKGNVPKVELEQIMLEGANEESIS